VALGASELRCVVDQDSYESIEGIGGNVHGEGSVSISLHQELNASRFGDSAESFH